MVSFFTIRNFHVSVEGKEVVKGINLTVQPGEIHAIMGPNGSGKSTLVNALMGHPHYTVTKGSAEFQGKDLLAMDPSDRARAGLFLAFQYPREIAGVTLRSFLFAAYKAQAETRPELPRMISPIKFKKLLDDHMKALHVDAAFAERFVNKGFSGGEKKKAEALQMSVLKPRIALMDETDSGLDIDALKIVAGGVNAMRPALALKRASSFAKASEDKSAGKPTEFSVVIVTHYARLLDYVTPDHVHVMVKGKIVESGGMDVARKLEKEGYSEYGADNGELRMEN